MDWEPLKDQWWRSKSGARERVDKINREKAERIAEEALSGTFAGRQALGGGAITMEGMREVARAAALRALEAAEQENNR